MSMLRGRRPSLRRAARWALRPPRAGSALFKSYRFGLSDNKVRAGAFFREHSIPTTRDLLSIKGSGEILSIEDGPRPTSIAELADGRYFAKPPLGSGGKGIFLFSREGSVFRFGDKALSEAEAEAELIASAGQQRSNSLLIQEEIRQHPGMSAISPFAVNTLRLVTIKRRGKPARLLHSVLKVSRRGSIVDNAASGGGIVLLVRDGATVGTGVDHWGKTHEVHPDTGEPLSPREIPLWREAVQACSRAHDHLPTYVTVGWDVAIGQTGPVIIENNVGWDETLNNRVDAGFQRLLLREGLKAVPEMALARLRARLAR